MTSAFFGLNSGSIFVILRELCYNSPVCLCLLSLHFFHKIYFGCSQGLGRERCVLVSCSQTRSNALLVSSSLQHAIVAVLNKWKTFVLSFVLFHEHIFSVFDSFVTIWFKFTVNLLKQVFVVLL